MADMPRESFFSRYEICSGKHRGRPSERILWGGWWLSTRAVDSRFLLEAFLEAQRRVIFRFLERRNRLLGVFDSMQVTICDARLIPGLVDELLP